MFMAFAYADYYPNGGIQDCIGVFPSETLATFAALEAKSDQWQVVKIDPETSTFEVVAASYQ